MPDIQPQGDQSSSEASATYWRKLFTLAEDALRDIANPANLVVRDEDGDAWIDVSEPSRVADGALRRIEEERSR